MQEKIAAKTQEKPHIKASKIEQIALEKFKEYDQNPRLHDAANIEKLVRSIREFGFTVPILVDSDNVIVAGHGRYLAAKALGLARAPAIRLDKLSVEQVRAYRLADNRLALDSRWNDDLLSLELIELIDSTSQALDAIGFSQAELDHALNARRDDQGEPSDFEVKDPEGETLYRCPKCGYGWSGAPAPSTKPQVHKR